MYDCETQTTWAMPDDLIARYGQEFMDKLSTRRKFDVELEQYVADESTEGRSTVLTNALCDSKNYIFAKIQCKYKNSDLVNTLNFPSIKHWHIKLTIEALKVGGDCSECACVSDLEKFLDCSPICSEDGQCLLSNKTFISATEAEFRCECFGRCRC